jgi:hypothetical protein
MFNFDWEFPEFKFPWRKVLLLVIIVIALLALAAAVRSWYREPSVITKTEYVTVPQEKIVEKIRTVAVPGPERIVTIEKPVIVDKLDLPREIADNDALQIVANADMPATKAGYSTCAVLDTGTGVSRIIAKEKPLPFFALLNEKELGGRVGYSTGGVAVDLYGRWTFARMGSVYLGGYAECAGTVASSGGSDVGARAMLDLSYRW